MAVGEAFLSSVHPQRQIPCSKMTAGLSSKQKLHLDSNVQDHTAHAWTRKTFSVLLAHDKNKLWTINCRSTL